MTRLSLITLAVLALGAVCTSCGSDEPSNNSGTAVQVKDEADRTVLIATDNGTLYNMNGGTAYATLPGCSGITALTMHGEDYYATGATTSGQQTYWAGNNAIALGGSGTTIDVVRSYDDVYVLSSDRTLYVNGAVQKTYPTDGTPVGIIRSSSGWGVVSNATDGVVFRCGNTATQSSMTNVRATGTTLISNAQGTGYIVSGYIYSVVNGQETHTPCFWTNGTSEAIRLEVNHSEKEQNNHTYKSGEALDVTRCNQNIFVAGSRNDGTNSVATVWVTSSSTDTDDAYAYWKADGNVDAEAVSTLTYGSDVYVMTVEHNLDTDTWHTRIWMNHKLKGTVAGIVGRGFVVI